MQNMSLFRLLPVVLLLICASARGQKVVVGFYNVENLYDTIPSLFYDDSDYSPQGKYGWDAERYGRKLRALARPVDDLSADILGLCEVESEQAVRDLVMTLTTDYNYIHRETNDPRGMDVALLYKGDKFFPSYVRQVDIRSSRPALYVRGTLHGLRADIIVCHLPSKLGSRMRHEMSLGALYDFADSLYHADRDARIVMMGDMNCDPEDRAFGNVFVHSHFFNPFLGVAAEGHGSYAYDSRWQMFDQIMLSDDFMRNRGKGITYSSAGIFINKYLVSRGDGDKLPRGYPLRTFSGGVYVGGPSDHLPVYVILEVR